jgi:hypothetical protein
MLLAVKRRRWVVQVWTNEGRLVSESRLRSGRRAKALARWHDRTAVGGHSWMSPVPGPPLWKVEVYKEPSTGRRT